MAVNSNPPVLISPDMDESHKSSFINQNFLNLANSLNPFLLSDGSNNRLLIGKDSAGNYVVKISKAGFDAFDGADSNLVFNSAQDIFKIVRTGTVTVSGSYSHGIGSQNTILGTQNVAHNLGFAPVMLVFVFNANLSTYEPVSSGSLAQDDSGISFSSTYNLAFVRVFGVDSSTASFSIRYRAYLSAGSTSGSVSETYKYFLLQETAN